MESSLYIKWMQFPTSIADAKKTLWSANNHVGNKLHVVLGTLKMLHKSETRLLASNGGFALNLYVQLIRASTPIEMLM